MKIILHFFVILFVLFSISCQKEEDAQALETGELFFSIDNSLLGTTIKDVKKSLSYSVPKLWLNSDTIICQKIMKSISYEKNNLRLMLQPLNVFIDSISKSYLVVSEIKSDFDSLNMKLIKQEINDILRIKFDSSTYKKAEFIKDGIEIIQFLVMFNNSVNFKLIFPTKNWKFIQFDYFISRETYMNEIKAVESSIGSIVYL